MAEVKKNGFQPGKVTTMSLECVKENSYSDERAEGNRIRHYVGKGG